MQRTKFLSTASIMSLLACGAAQAASFDIPASDLTSALDKYMKQSGVSLMYSSSAVKGIRSSGIRGDLEANDALSRLLSGTGFTIRRDASGAIGVVRGERSSDLQPEPSLQLAQATPGPRATVETVTVTSSKLGGADVQSIPIAITALSQEELTSRQVAGGPDLIKEVPNLTFTKTNFTGYSIQIRGIGTQAISVTTDPAVAVAFNDTPFIRNHFFEQEFYDVSQVEVLRGPQGTLYGRNATAGVVNVTSAKPTDQFEAMASADIGNYKNRRFEAMLNLPIVDDKIDLRLAAEWTKRDGYSFNTLTDSPIDGRDLWSGRASLRWKPIESVTADFVWEHFSENDDRLRSSKQLCNRDEGVTNVLGVPVNNVISLGQGCLPSSMYAPEAFGVPNALSLPYFGGLIGAGFGLSIGNPLSNNQGDPYASVRQSQNLRDIESTLNPQYLAKNDTLEINVEWRVAPALTLNSATGYNADFLWSTEDFNRFNTRPGIFSYGGTLIPAPDGNYQCGDGYIAIGMTCSAAGHGDSDGAPTGEFCDPQLGCSNRLVAEDLSEEHSWQINQELRLTSSFDGPFNFSAGANYLHYETEENYYVFFNTITMYAAVDGLSGRDPNIPWVPGVEYNAHCLNNGYQLADPNIPTNPESCLGYLDPNPLSNLNNRGHNYFLNQNPYTLNSYALFGEAYYNITDSLKLTGGLRWTDDQKHFVEIPSELLTVGFGYPVTGVLDQTWKKWTGRAVLNWTPKFDFTDQSMFYASYAHGYKAGGANPPGAILLTFSGGDISNPTHPKTFEPEYNDAFELGTKNTALDGDLSLNANIFYYDYKGYQISEIVDRTAINLNFDATVKGAELQATWQPLPGLKFSLAGGYEDARLADGSKAIDLMDRTAGNSNWLVVKPFVTQASNCILPAYVVAYQFNPANGPNYYAVPSDCGEAYNLYHDPVTGLPYQTGTNTVHGEPLDPSYHGFDPLAGTPGDPYTGQNTYNGIDYGPAPNNGTGFYKDVSGKQLPNAPHFTVSLTADYTLPLSSDWAATLHSDFYWQSQSWARVFNAVNDEIHGYSTANLALILTDASGWQVMGYVKNVFNKTAITGTFLNSDDTGLTTNIFLTDPRLFGVRVTKHFGGSDNGFSLFGGENGKPHIWLTIGGNFSQLQDNWQAFEPSFASNMAAGLPDPAIAEKAPGGGFDWQGRLSYQPEDSEWVMKAGIRYGRATRNRYVHKSLAPQTTDAVVLPYPLNVFFGTTLSCAQFQSLAGNDPQTACPFNAKNREFIDTNARSSEQHMMLDFTLGKDVGLGSFGNAGHGTLSAGLRIAQFTSAASSEVNSDPVYNFNPTAVFSKYHDWYDATTSEKRTFHGVGPQVVWDSQNAIWSDAAWGQITFDWGVNAAVLFGTDKVALHRKSSHAACGYNSTAGIYCNTTTNPVEDIARSRSVTVPNLGGYGGLSANYSNAKISFGYRVDEFFGAMDGGQDTAKSYNRGFYGPYLNVSIGLGG